jgi:hypothetical protein
MMAANLTGQVRGIASVVTAVASGDLKRKLAVDAKGEIASLANTINEMIDTLATFADQPPTWRAKWAWKASLAARRGCRAPAGTWKDLPTTSTSSPPI